MIEDLQRLLQFAQTPNLCDFIPDDELTKLGGLVCQDAEIDEASRSEWMKRSEKAMDMALQVVEEKSFPWDNASNVKTPLLTEAALQFHARAYPAIIQGSNIVKGKVTGGDPQGLKIDRAERVAKHMNFQLTEEMPEWEEDMDRLILALPIEGCEFKKVRFDPVKGRNVSEWIRPKDFIVNDKTRNLEDCPRATHVITRYPHQIAEMQRSGTYKDTDIHLSKDDDQQEEIQELYEQYRMIDLDEDGVKEPYIVTVHKESRKVLRVRANWEPTGIVVSDGANTFKAFDRQGVNVAPSPMIGAARRLVSVQKEQYFVKYSFLPSPDGSFYDVGFGQLVTPLLASIDSIINQLIDAGTLANAPPGLIDEGMKMLRGAGSGDVRFSPGQFKKVKAGSASKIADSIYQFQFPGPSATLFSMLGALIDQVKAITSISDAMTGASSGPNEPVGTMLARIDQGMKVFNAIYKRIHRALGKEFKLLYRLNSIYLQPSQYFSVVDSPVPVEIQIFDYQGDGTDIAPVSDPSVATTTQRMAKAQFLMGLPLPNATEKLKRVLDSAEIENQDPLFEAPPSQPDPKQIETMEKAKKIAAEVQQIAVETAKTRAEISDIYEQRDFERLKLVIEALEADNTRMQQLESMLREGLMDELRAQQSRVGNVATGPGQQMVPQAPQFFGPGGNQPAMPGLGQPAPNPGVEGLG